MRRIINTHLCVIAVMLTSLPALADAALYKCVDEKTKAVTYSGTACVSGNESKLSITENAIMDGAAAQREIGRRQMADQANQESRRCGASSSDIEHERQAENALLTAKNAHGVTDSSKSVKAAQANLDSARDRRNNPCDPGIAQQGRAARADAEAADDARRQRDRAERMAAARAADDRAERMAAAQAAEDRAARAADDANRKLDDIINKLRN
jgi:hypothetical protein